LKRRRSRHMRRRAGAVAVAALAAAFLWIGVPRALARVPLFRVRQIDLVGEK
jgi:hypothetical protein